MPVPVVLPAVGGRAERGEGEVKGTCDSLAWCGDARLLCSGRDSTGACTVSSKEYGSLCFGRNIALQLETCV